MKIQLSDRDSNIKHTSSTFHLRLDMTAATAQTRPSNSVPMAGLGGFQVGGRPIVLRQLLLW